MSEWNAPNPIRNSETAAFIQPAQPEGAVATVLAVSPCTHAQSYRLKAGITFSDQQFRKGDNAARAHNSE